MSVPLSTQLPWKIAWLKGHAHTQGKGKEQAKAKVVSLSFFNVQFPQNVGSIPLHFQGHLKYIFVIDWLYYMSSWQTKKEAIGKMPAWKTGCSINTALRAKKALFI